MTAIDNTPHNKNFLSPINFVFQIKRSPHLNFFVQEVNLPSITAENLETNNPFVRIPSSGDQLRFGDLRVTFKVDEDLQNWFEVHNWIRALGFPDNFSEYRQIASVSETSGQGITSDISLVILNQRRIPAFEVSFRNAFPINLSELMFRTTESDVNYLTATADFKYILYDVKKL
jgi:hypothetical protein